VRARDQAAQSQGDVTVELLDGTHRLDSPLRFDGADSGRDGHTVTWKAASGANPVLSGAQPVTGWELDDAEAGIYKADVGAGLETRQLYVDGVLAQRAQISVAPSDLTLNPDGLTVNNEDLGYLADLPDQQRIELVADLTWTHRITPVDSISGSTVTLQQPAWDNNTYGWDTIQSPFTTPRFFLANSHAFLDQAGEWFLDSGAGTLYYKPLAGQDLADTSVELPMLETLVEVGGSYHEPADNLRFEGLTFTGTSWLGPSSSDGYANMQTGSILVGEQPHRPDNGFHSCARGCYGFEGDRNNWAQTPAAVQVSAAEHITFLGNTFVNLGSYGLGIGNDANAHATGVGLGAQNIDVLANTFTESAGGGIAVGGVRPDAHHPSDERMVNSDIRISNNEIFDTAHDYPDNAAILGTYATRLTVEHNYVSDMPYSGITIGWGWGANDEGGSPAYVDRGLYDFQPIYDTPTTLTDVHIRGNHVRNVVQYLSDAGCIYTLAAQPNSTIEGNFCENLGQFGMYFDEGSRYIAATDNVFLNNASNWAHANAGRGLTTGDLTVTGNYMTNPNQWIEDGEHGNVVTDNVHFSANDIPEGAQQVIDQAGPTGEFDPPVLLDAVLEADPETVDAGESTTVTMAVENLTDRPVIRQDSSITVPEGWQATRTGEEPRRGLMPGARATLSWEVTVADELDALVSQGAVSVTVDFWAQREIYVVDQSLTLTALNPLTTLDGYGSVPSRFAEAGPQLAILTEGADMWEDASGAFDEYGTIYQEGAVGENTTVTARVTHIDDTHPWAKAGVVIRNDLTADGSSPGYAVMTVTPGNGVAFQWDSDGNGYLDSSSAVGGVQAPAWVRLVRSGSQVSGYYSTDGSTWTQVGPTADLDGITATQDAGLIATSHTAGVTGKSEFSDFSVSE
jgi:hypothetical protein